jgi:hypothetical protein
MPLLWGARSSRPPFSASRRKHSVELPKSSPKRIETKKQSGTFGRDAGFSGATVKFPALTALFRRKLLSNKHFLRSAFYRGGFHRSLAHPPTRHALLWAAPRSLASATQTPPKPFASV